MNKLLAILIPVSCLVLSGCDDRGQSAKLNQGGLGDLIVYDEGSIELNSCVFYPGSLTYDLSLINVTAPEIDEKRINLVDCVEAPALWDPIPLYSLSIIDEKLTLVFSLDDQLTKKIEAGIKEQPVAFGIVVLTFFGNDSHSSSYEGKFNLQYKDIVKQ